MTFNHLSDLKPGTVELFILHDERLKDIARKDLENFYNDVFCDRYDLSYDEMGRMIIKNEDLDWLKNFVKEARTDSGLLLPFYADQVTVLWYMVDFMDMNDDLDKMPQSVFESAIAMAKRLAYEINKTVTFVDDSLLKSHIADIADNIDLLEAIFDSEGIVVDEVGNAYFVNGI